MTVFLYNRNLQLKHTQGLEGSHFSANVDSAKKNEQVEGIDTDMKELGVVDLDNKKLLSMLKPIVAFPEMYILSGDKNYIEAAVKETEEIIKDLKSNYPAFLTPNQLLLLINNHQNTKRENDFKDDIVHIDVRWKILMSQFTTNQMRLDATYKSALLEADSTMLSGVMDIANSLLIVPEPGNPVFTDEQVKERNENLAFYQRALEDQDKKQQYKTGGNHVVMFSAGCKWNPAGQAKDKLPAENQEHKAGSGANQPAADKVTSPPANNKELKQVTADKPTAKEEADKIKDIKEAMSKFQENITGIMGTMGALLQYDASLFNDSLEIFKKVCKALDRQNNKDEAQRKEDKLLMNQLLFKLSQDLLRICIIIAVCKAKYQGGIQA